MSKTPKPTDYATVHAFAALKPDGHIDPASVRPTVEDACRDASEAPVVEVEIVVAKKGGSA